MQILLLVTFIALINYIISYNLWIHTDTLYNALILMFIILFIELLFSSILMAIIVEYVKEEELYLKTSIKRCVARIAPKFLDYLIIGFTGSIALFTIILSPLYFLGLASNVIAGYSGFDAIYEGAKRFHRDFGKYFVRIVPDVILALLILIMFTYASLYVSEPFSPKILFSTGSFLAWLLLSKTTIKTSREYLYHGLKICVYCSREIPIASRECRWCKAKLK